MSNTQVAQAIYNQLGANNFSAMTGAKDMTIIDNGLQFKLPSRFAKDGINLVRITLNEMDTYDIEFSKCRGLNVKQVSYVGGVFADSLQDVFSEATGLDTVMPRLIRA